MTQCDRNLPPYDSCGYSLTREGWDSVVRTTDQQEHSRDCCGQPYNETESKLGTYQILQNTNIIKLAPFGLTVLIASCVIHTT